MSVKLINPDTLFPAAPFQFSHVAIATGQQRVSISGQVALDKEMNLIGAGSIAEQAAAALENLGLALAAAGAEKTDVVSLRVYMVNYNADYMEALVPAMKSFFGEHAPASTWLGIQALAIEGLLIEIEAEAVIG